VLLEDLLDDRQQFRSAVGLGQEVGAGVHEEKSAEEDPNLWRFGPGLELHLVHRSVTVDQLRVPLSRGQFNLLACLAQSPSKPIAAAMLVAILAKDLLYVNATHVKREIQQVRDKLLRFGPWLMTEPDGSYRFQEPS